MDLFKIFISYLFSFSFVFLVFIYFLKMPAYIAQNNELVHEYYKNYYNIIFDFFLVIAYFLIASFFIYMFQVRDNVLQLCIVALTTFIISTLFLIYFWMRPQGTSFFSRWFHQVGFRAVFFDVLLLLLIYMIMMEFYNLII